MELLSFKSPPSSQWFCLLKYLRFWREQQMLLLLVNMLPHQNHLQLQPITFRKMSWLFWNWQCFKLQVKMPFIHLLLFSSPILFCFCDRSYCTILILRGRKVESVTYYAKYHKWDTFHFCILQLFSNHFLEEWNTSFNSLF